MTLGTRVLDPIVFQRGIGIRVRKGLFVKVRFQRHKVITSYRRAGGCTASENFTALTFVRQQLVERIRRAKSLYRSIIATCPESMREQHRGAWASPGRWAEIWHAIAGKAVCHAVPLEPWSHLLRREAELMTEAGEVGHYRQAGEDERLEAGNAGASEQKPRLRANNGGSRRKRYSCHP